MVTTITTLTTTTTVITITVMRVTITTTYGYGGDCRQSWSASSCTFYFDARCLSLVLPAQDVAPLQHRSSDRLATLPMEPMQGAPPDDFLRPPIPLSL